MLLRLGLVLLTLLLAAPAAQAQDVAADALLEQGLALREHGEHARALVYFQRAYEIEPSPRALAQIALAHQALHQWVTAFKKLTEAIAQSSDPWIRSRRTALETALASARTHVAFVHITGGPPGHHVWIGQEDAGEAPLAAPVVCEPGLVDIEIRDGTDVLLHRQVPVEAGATVDLEFSTEVATYATTPPPVAATAATTAPRANALGVAEESEARPSNTLRVVGWTSTGIGVAALAAGVVFQVLREGAVSSANECADQLTARTGCSVATWNDRQSTPGSYQSMAYIGYGAGAALVVTGLIMVLVAPSGESADVALACGPSFGHVGAMCEGRF